MNAARITAVRGLRAVLGRAARILCTAGLVLGVLLGVVPGAAQAQTLGAALFGPYPLTLPNTQPLTYSNGFNATPGPGVVEVSISAPNALTQASLTFNGTQVMSIADFANGVTTVDKPITLLANNTFSFTVAGARGTTVTLTVYALIMPTPTGLTPSPLALNIGNTGQMTATLSPTPTASGTLSVTSSNTSVATVPSSVSFASGQSSVTVPVTAVAPGSATITVSANGGSASATATVNAPPTVSITSPAANTVYNAPATITVTANAADSDGTVSKVDFYAGVTLIGTATAAPYSVNWANVAAGSYTLTAVATDNQGAATTSAPVAILVNAPPTVSITAPAANTTFNAPATITVSANASDADGTVSKVDFYQGATLIGTATAAPYSISWANVAAGSYTLTAVATDNRGATTTSAPVAILVDAPPTVSITAPTANATFNAPATITVSATAADSDGTVSKVDFYQGATLIGTATAAPYSVNWANVAAGSYTLTAVATDNNGATTTSAPVAILVDAPPTVSITAPAANASFNAPATITVSANAADSDGTIAKVDFYQGATLIGTATAAPYSINWANVAAGSYTLTAVATDNQGATTTSTPVAILVNAPPTVSITAPLANTIFNAPATITVSANAADADGTVSKVDFYAGATLIGTATAAPYSVSWANVAAGSYTLTAVATDNSGATTTSAAVPITVNAPPTVSITAPVANASFNPPATITVTANAADSDGTVAKVDFYQGATLIGTATAAPYSITWANVPIGSYTLTAVATDNNGAATTSAAVGITVKTAAALYFIQVDHLGTPRLIADGNQNTVWRWDNQEPFGNDSPNQDPGNTGNVFDFPLRFPGQYADRETNLAYNYYRDYDPATGRYVKSDPVGLVAGLNTYAYVSSRPIMFVDLSGLAAACGKSRSCQDMIASIRQLLESAYPQTYAAIKCTIKCDKLLRGSGKTSGGVITLNTDDYGEVYPNSNLIGYIQTMAHELRHCKTSPWEWSNFGSSNPDSIFANQSHVQLDQAAEQDAWGIVSQAQKLF